MYRDQGYDLIGTLTIPDLVYRSSIELLVQNALFLTRPDKESKRGMTNLDSSSYKTVSVYYDFIPFPQCMPFLHNVWTV